MFVQAVAGPSRSIGSLRLLHTSCLRFASPKPPSPRRGPPAPPQPKPASPSALPTKAAEPARNVPARVRRSTAPVPAKIEPSQPTKIDGAHDPLASHPDWPWIHHAESDAGPERYERLIFARPVTGVLAAPNALRNLWILATVLVVGILAAPNSIEVEGAVHNTYTGEHNNIPVPRSEEERAGDAKDRWTFIKLVGKTMLAHIGLVKVTLVIPVVVGTLAVTSVYSGQISRMVQLRVKQADGAFKNQIRYIRPHTGTPWRTPQTIADLEEVSVRTIDRGSEFLNVNIGVVQGYRMDFGPLAAAATNSQEDIVLSLTRMERVFGEIPPAVEKRALWSGLTDWLGKRK